MMEVRLKVRSGKAAGQEIRLPGTKFIIGRAEDCHLRPNSDLVSRHHCAILCDEGFAVVREFGSKNGTYVNGNRIAGECELKTGDLLKVGPLEFEVAVTPLAAPAAAVPTPAVAQTAATPATAPAPTPATPAAAVAPPAVTPSKKRPAVHSVKEAAARTAQNASTGSGGGMDLDEWLAEPATESTSQTVNIRDAETEEINLGRTMAVPAMPELPDPAGVTADSPTRELSQTASAAKLPGKLPPPASKGKDSGSAAADTLRKFFNRR